MGDTAEVADVTDIAPARDFDIVLVLSGGNALGAFEVGVYQALHEHGLYPDWIVGTSIGAINGALIAGSRREHRLDVLRTFWRPNDYGWGTADTSWFPVAMDTARRTVAASWTLAAGRSGIFGPLLSSMSPWTANEPSLFETDQLRETMDRLVDFDILNAGPCRFTATAVDLATGDDVVFDTRHKTLDARHIRASAALPVAFPPVEIDGRWLVDGGLSANLPLDPVLADPSPRPALVMAVDLLPLGQPLPLTIGEAAGRMQDLIFAAQSRRTIERWTMAHAARDDVSIALLRIAYTEQVEEVAAKAMDFSGPTVAQRWKAGYAAVMPMLDRMRDETLQIGKPGLNIVETA
ncbi:hypothetical protein ASG29_16160 [Sphingomonas sp. Leaf412]|uniref:patatin-like phospholipase family protein n=1 Tax=Sphingomonas sp. Leaf412 TaxID=1736370 RepID=UPI0006FDFE1C|nr:patatin-like phospholipase family protein [Sphingomonas sp. Leaf412]KQT31034.1 hypothetical protein ASG29_16160 [Sphingomonas sp. Leaf412]